MIDSIPLRRLPFHPPADYYCDQLVPVDEQICALLAKRKELSDSNPGFPQLNLIEEWSQQHGLNEDWLRMLFSLMSNEKQLTHQIEEPYGFLKFIPILKSLEIDNVIYSVIHMKQYRNASVVYIETEINTDEPFARLGHTRFDLKLSPEYQCRPNGGYGQKKGMVYTFVVTPALPDNVDDLEFHLSIKPVNEVSDMMKEISLTERTLTIK